MPRSTPQTRIGKPIFQFSVFAENKVGILNLITGAFSSLGIHVLGVSCLDQTDCAVVRFVPSDAAVAECALKKEGVAFSKTQVLALAISAPEDLSSVTQALVQAEINIHYLYPLFCLPSGRCGLILSTNDLDLSASILSGYGIPVLGLDDLSR